MSGEEWPPPDARARAALWEAERRLIRGEYLASAIALRDAVACGNSSTAAVARGLRLLATAGYRHETGDAARAEGHLGEARARLTPFLPVFEEVDLVALLDLVSRALGS